MKLLKIFSLAIIISLLAGFVFTPIKAQETNSEELANILWQEAQKKAQNFLKSIGGEYLKLKKERKFQKKLRRKFLNQGKNFTKMAEFTH